MINTDTICLTVLISTLNDGIINLEKTVSLRRPEIVYLIIHQTKTLIQIPDFLKRDDIKIISTNTTGLAKSRNIGLKNCVTKYALIADDDIEYIPDGIDEILEIIKSKELDFGTFKIKTSNSEPDYKNYTQKAFLYGLKKHHYISSIEILLNINSINSNNVCFDEKFGLGTLLKAAEETILIHDMVSKKLKGMYFPIDIVKHPYESSGKDKTSFNFKIFRKGAIAARTKNYGYRSSSRFLFRRLLDYIIFYYGVFYIKIKLPNFLIFIK